MYNSVKRRLGLAGSILSIILGAVGCFTCLIGFIAITDYNVIDEAMVVLILTLGASIALLVLGSKLCRMPEKHDYGWDSRMGNHITIFIFLGIMFILSLVLGVLFVAYDISYYYTEFTIVLLFSYFMMVISLVALPLEIVSFCLKPERKVRESQFQPYQTTQPIQPVYAPIQNSTAVTPQTTVFTQFASRAKEVEKSNTVSPKTQALENDISQLKKLKEQGIINEEQYNSAIQKLISNFAK